MATAAKEVKKALNEDLEQAYVYENEFIEDSPKDTYDFITDAMNNKCKASFKQFHGVKFAKIVCGYSDVRFMVEKYYGPNEIDDISPLAE